MASRRRRDGDGNRHPLCRASSGLVLFSPFVAARAGLSPVVTSADWNSEGTRRLLMEYVPECILVAMILLYSRMGNKVRLANVIWGASPREWLVPAGTTATVSLILAALQVWPWTWQWPPHVTLRIITASLAGSQFAGIAIWVFATAVAIPILEEIVFRFGVLELIRGVTGSTTLAVSGSAGLFALGHLGGTLHPDRAHVVNAAWLLVAGLLLGSITVRNRGHLGPAIAAHIARNTLELSTLALAITR